MKKTTKIITVALCAILALLMVFTMVASAFAAEEKRVEIDVGDTGARLYFSDENILDSYRDIAIRIEYRSLAGEEFADMQQEMARHDRFSGRLICGISTAVIYANEDNEALGITKGMPLSQTVLSRAEIWIPLTEAQKAYADRGMVVLDAYRYYYGYADPFEEVLFYEKTRDGVTYVVFNAELSTCYLLVCAADSEGAPVLLEWYEQGVVGWLWRLRGAVLMALVGIVLFLAFYIRVKPKKAKAAPSEPTAETEAEEQPEKQDAEENQ